MFWTSNIFDYSFRWLGLSKRIRELSATLAGKVQAHIYATPFPVIRRTLVWRDPVQFQWHIKLWRLN